MTESIAAEEKPVQTIVDIENEIARELFPKVEKYLQLFADCYTLSCKVFEAAYPEVNPPLAKQVCTNLLLRLNNDLRAIMMLAKVGYEFQANALAASVYECAFTIGVILDNHNLAREWLDHDNPKVSFGNAYDLTKLALTNYGAHTEWTDAFYQVYRQLCWAKHLNPISEQQGGMEKTGDVIDFILGPRADELTERGICYCSVYTVLFSIIGLDMFIRKHVKPRYQKSLLLELKSLGKRQQELYKIGLSRWGSADPFPGKW